MKNLNKKATRQAMLNEMKKDSYTKREGIYANLIINVLEEANKFDESIDNVYVDHNIIEMILIYDFLSTCLSDIFGRNEKEFSPKFIAACNRLKQQFDSDYPDAKSFVNNKTSYFTPKCFGVRTFMRKIISRIVFPLGIKAKVQPLFVRLGIYIDGMLNIAWEKGKKGGTYVMQDDCEISRNLTESEIRLLEDQINEAIRLNGHEVLEFDDLADIIDAFVAQAA